MKSNGPHTQMVHAASDQADLCGTSSALPRQVLRATRWGTVLILTGIMLAAGMLGMVLTPLLEPARIELGLSDMQMSIVMGLAKGLPMALFSVPVGLMVDHGNRTRLIIAMGLCWTGGTFWTAFASDFLSLFLARALVGFGVGSLLGAVLSIIADVCLPDRRGRVLLIASIGSWLGIALAFGMGGALFGHFSQPRTGLIEGLAPWRQAVFAFGLLGVAALIPLMLLREPVRHEREQRDNAVLPALRGLWSRRWFLLPLLIGSMTGGVAEGAAGIWSAPVLTRNFGLQPHEFGGWMGGVILISGIVGSLLGGFVADWGSKLRRRGGILIGAVVATALTVPAGAFAVMPTVPLFALALGVLLVGGVLVTLVSSAAVTVLIPNEERGTVLALLSLMGTLVGLGLAPAIVALGGWLHGDENHLAETIAMVGVVTGLVSLVGYVVAMLNAPEPIGERD